MQGAIDASDKFGKVAMIFLRISFQRPNNAASSNKQSSLRFPPNGVIEIPEIGMPSRRSPRAENA